MDEGCLLVFLASISALLGGIAVLFQDFTLIYFLSWIALALALSIFNFLCFTKEKRQCHSEGE